MEEIGQLPEFNVVRLLEAAHQQLRDAPVEERSRDAMEAALSAVNDALEAKHQSFTHDASEHAEQLRRAAHGLVTIAGSHAQQAMQAMLAAADMSR